MKNRKQLYRNLQQKIGLYPCVTLGSVSSIDKCLSGPNGEIWEDGKGGYLSFYVDPRAKTLEEKLIAFDSKQLKRYISLYKIPKNPDDQMYWANNPNARVAEIQNATI